MENQLLQWMQRVNFPFQLTRHMAVIGNLHKTHHFWFMSFPLQAIQHWVRSSKAILRGSKAVIWSSKTFLWSTFCVLWTSKALIRSRQTVLRSTRVILWRTSSSVCTSTCQVRGLVLWSPVSPSGASFQCQVGVSKR